MTKLIIENLTVQFQQKKKTITAVDDVTFSVKSGEIYGIVGLSGAGKSTLIRTINLLQRPSSGNIKIDGTSITDLKDTSLRDKRQKIGMIFQHFNLIQNKTIGDNIRFSLKAGNYPKEKIDTRIDELLKIVDLLDKKNVYPNNLSGGQKQRIGIARALANNPEILLCDEATSALDVETTEEILLILKEINQTFGITIIFITHELDVAKRLFNRIAVMEKGQIVEENTTFDIFANPQQPITKKLVNRYLNIELPAEILEQLDNGLLIELRYQGEQTLEPLISDIAKKSDVNISIVHGKIEYIQNKSIGLLCVYLTGNQHALGSAYTQLKNNVHSIRVLKGGTKNER
ncbi:methionine ABC transporter ATP-binding protein [Vagococcus vulneris]|uniref:Methionine ABC transporter ATP-binding protein n=1 Tax=Vagococcus vulneris TaxID=1977869 RepID=A0A429ZZ58_9ENTE|nr:ATP-binding cassette domain-containing protein [Vagococcus vulneris]RST99283.1 methionine ABC transporter ATP-binding protein [Vagococcus vulneris]